MIMMLTSGELSKNSINLVVFYKIMSHVRVVIWHTHNTDAVDNNVVAGLHELSNKW